MAESQTLLGLRYDDVTLDTALEHITKRHPQAKFCYVVTPNADHIVRLARRPELREIYQNAWLCILDSQLIAMLCKWLGLAAPAVLTGTELTFSLLARSSGRRIAIIGLQASIIAQLQSAYPAVQFHHHQPPENLMNNPAAFAAACKFAVAAQAEFIIIALGSPLQEYLAAKIAENPTSCGVGLCTGAALEFCTGSKRRAPLWMRVHGLEWLHRLVHEPRRLAKRYLCDDILIFKLLLSAAIAARRSH